MLFIPSLSCYAGHQQILNVENISVQHGKFSGIIGPNGAGKSTLLKAICGDVRAQGDAILHEKSIKHWSPNARARQLGVLPQSSQLSFPFSAREVVALGLTPLSLNQQQARLQIEAEMRKTNCWHLAEKSYPLLSGGEKQRVQLARVLLQLSQATQAPLLLLDEPTSAQDLRQQHSLLSLVKTLATDKGYAVLAILHDLNQVLRYCDHCFVMANGTVQHEGSPRDTLTPDRIESNWGYRPQRLVAQASEHIALV